MALSVLVFLDIDLAFTADFRLGPLAEGCHCLGADAVQARRRFVTAFVEFGARARHRQHDLQSRLLGLGMHPDGNAATIVADAQTTINVDLHLYTFAIAGESLIHTVVNQFIDQVVQPFRSCVADIHTGPVANVLRVAEDIDIFGFIFSGVYIISTWRRNLDVLAHGISLRK